MIWKIFFYEVVIFFLISTALAQLNGQEAENVNPFVHANIRFEQNVTDGDVEVVFEVKADEEGLKTLTVVSPDGYDIIHFNSPDKHTMGIRQFHLESPEPKDIESIKSAFPEGEYEFLGFDVNGKKYYGKDSLTHKLPEPVTILQPQAQVLGTRITELEISWTVVPDIISYSLEVDHSELGIKVNIELPSTVNNFILPRAALEGGKYKLSVGAIYKDGNRSFTEKTFLIAGEE